MKACVSSAPATLRRGSQLCDGGCSLCPHPPSLGYPLLTTVQADVESPPLQAPLGVALLQAGEEEGACFPLRAAVPQVLWIFRALCPLSPTLLHLPRELQSPPEKPW